MISFWSVLSASLWFAFASLLLFLLRGHTKFLAHHGTLAWSLAVLITTIRLLLPLDGKHMFVLRSYRLLPALRRGLEYSLAPGLTVSLLLRRLWLLGALVGVVFVVCGTISDKVRLNRVSALPRPPEVLAAIRRCGISPAMVCMTPAAVLPVSNGFIHPSIYLPADLSGCSEDDLVWVLKHEMTHIAGGDAWLNMGYLLFRCLFWWNPLVHLSQRSVKDSLELRCDKVILNGLSQKEQTAYGDALCRMARKAQDGAPRFLCALEFTRPERATITEIRVKRALAGTFRWSKGELAAVALSVALFAVSYLFIWQPAGFPDEKPTGTDDPTKIYNTTPNKSYLKQTPSGDYELWNDGEFVCVISADTVEDDLFQGLEVLP